MRYVALLLLSACIGTQATKLAGFDAARRATCPAVIKVYRNAASVGGEFAEIAYLTTGSSDPVSDAAIVENMKKKAAAMGANGILLEGIEKKTGSPGILTGAFSAKPEGKGVAIWVHHDTVGIWQKCAT